MGVCTLGTSVIRYFNKEITPTDSFIKRQYWITVAYILQLKVGIILVDFLIDKLLYAYHFFQDEAQKEVWFY